ncbi:hypothetical protein [Streptomyces sp. NPDC005784]|uniref:hypothetical protein n=1 Tax=Streptomyces sp. NPDC005784 TaxID=3364731 RepID=UPI0036B5641B
MRGTAAGTKRVSTAARPAASPAPSEQNAPVADSRAHLPKRRRCGKARATPKQCVLFDDLVRRTAAGSIVPVQFRTATTVHASGSPAPTGTVLRTSMANSTRQVVIYP